MSMAKSCIRICKFLTHNLDFHGFSRHSGWAFSGIMPLIFISSGKKGSSFAYWTFLAHLSTTCSRGAFRVVMCLSCVVNNFFKHLLPNCWANLDQTWQECSLGGPLQKLFTEFDSIKNSGCHGNEIEFFKQFFKNLLWNR